MRNTRLFFAVGAVAILISVLIYTATSNTAKAVVTVDQLVGGSTARNKIRLGARVTEDPIVYATQPEFLLRFTVRDIQQPLEKIDAVYHGIMPDTFQAGRDVILEGSFDGKTFAVTSLLTQCPSKYEPPLPGANAGAQKTP